MGLRYTVWIHTTITNPTSWIYFIVFLSQYPKKYSEYTNKNYVKMLPWPLVSTPKAFSPEPNSPEYSLEGLMLKLKLQYFGYLMRRADSLEKTMMLGKIESRRRRGLQRIRWLDGITDSMDMSLGKLRSWWWTGKPGILQSLGSQKVRLSPNLAPT